MSDLKDPMGLLLAAARVDPILMQAANQIEQELIRLRCQEEAQNTPVDVLPSFDITQYTDVIRDVLWNVWDDYRQRLQDGYDYNDGEQELHKAMTESPELAEWIKSRL